MSDKIDILFVDDSDQVLDGLKRSLRFMREQWRMHFARGGQEALQLLAETPCKVVVSDMRMPGMNGAELLERVRETQPDTIRIILSGYSDREAILHTVGPAHQYLAKPCDTTVLVDVVQRGIHLRRILHSSELRGLAGGVEALPAPPETFNKLMRTIADEGASLDSVSEVVESDVALTADLLKLTNSAYFGFPSKVIDVKRAVSFLGFELIKSIAVISGLFRDHVADPESAKGLARLNQRSTAIGLMAKEIARDSQLPSAMCDQIACSAMLSHVGTLLFMSTWPDKFSQAIALVEEQGMPIVDAEKAVFGSDHAALGAYLLGLWGFSDPIVEAVAYHHTPDAAGYAENEMLSIVYATQLLARIVTRDGSWEEAATTVHVNGEYLARANVLEKMPRWFDIVQDIKVLENELPVARGPTPDVSRMI